MEVKDNKEMHLNQLTWHAMDDGLCSQVVTSDFWLIRIKSLSIIVSQATLHRYIPFDLSLDHDCPCENESEVH